VFPRERNSASRRVGESAARRLFPSAHPPFSVCLLSFGPFSFSVSLQPPSSPSRPFSLDAASAAFSILVSLGTRRFSASRHHSSGIVHPASPRLCWPTASRADSLVSSFLVPSLPVSSAIANGARVARSSEHETLHACGATPGGRDAQRRRARHRYGRSGWMDRGGKRAG